jgi:SAM-dependent methyltransferase
LITKNTCSICKEHLEEIIDLGKCPPANNFVDSKSDAVTSYPLIVDFCNKCFCIQLRHCLSKDELYSYYTYSTPKIESLNNHYEALLKKLKSLGFGHQNQSCIEIGSNNGNLLKFLEPNFEKVLGVDPAKNIASIAVQNGIETVIDFFSTQLANQISKRFKKFDVAIARHMFAHNEDPAELLSAMSLILDEDGIFLIENAYALDTFLNGEFDQIYHEHMFYFSALSIDSLMKRFDFELIDFEHAPVHGGSGVFICGKKGRHNVQESVVSCLENERKVFEGGSMFSVFKDKVQLTRSKTLKLLQDELLSKRVIGAYGAPAKAFTVLSYYGLNEETVKFCVDTTPTKIGKVFPVFNIPVISEEELRQIEYDTLIVNAWNYKEDILKKASSIFKKGTKLIFIVPELETYIVE